LSLRHPGFVPKPRANIRFARSPPRGSPGAAKPASRIGLTADGFKSWIPAVAGMTDLFRGSLSQKTEEGQKIKSWLDKPHPASSNY